MHVSWGMRTTIEMRDDHRAALLQLAAKRGEKGFSSIVAEAISAYLASAKATEDVRRRAAQLRGSLGEKEAEELRASAARLREEWR
jgi:predicted transcriptional regulator